MATGLFYWGITWEADRAFPSGLAKSQSILVRPKLSPFWAATSLHPLSSLVAHSLKKSMRGALTPQSSRFSDAASVCLARWPHHAWSVRSCSGQGDRSVRVSGSYPDNDVDGASRLSASRDAGGFCRPHRRSSLNLVISGTR